MKTDFQSRFLNCSRGDRSCPNFDQRRVDDAHSVKRADLWGHAVGLFLLGSLCLHCIPLLSSLGEGVVGGFLILEYQKSSPTRHTLTLKTESVRLQMVWDRWVNFLEVRLAHWLIVIIFTTMTKFERLHPFPKNLYTPPIGQFKNEGCLPKVHRLSKLVWEGWWKSQGQ